ncbi:hypothetical protein [Fischerella sp. PCC 9605]|uniref:hypothetical protein n=1 Tax=Fischerella sp. PCC 9605 TaxID=1173024 RepID=UPI0004794A43|nr:hypothetical protein [Fischerella sp. PCC 9605]
MTNSQNEKTGKVSENGADEEWDEPGCCSEGLSTENCSKKLQDKEREPDQTHPPVVTDKSK